jgi:hypothetical protein
MDQITSSQPELVVPFFDAVSDVSTKGGDAAEVLKDANVSTPGLVSALLGKLPEKAHGAVLDSVLKGMEIYKNDHGFEAPAGLVEMAINSAYSQTRPFAEILHGQQNIRMDSATSLHHDQLSLNPAVVIVSIMKQFSEAVPFAAYLSADVKSNEAKLGIISHYAGSNFGAYTVGGTLNGIAGGFNYLDSERVVSLSVNGGAGPFTAQVTAQNTGAVSASNPAAPVLRGRSMVFVNGLPVAEEATNNQSGTGNSAISGTATVGSTDHAISGTVNTDTGLFTITATPALPANVLVEGVAYIDFERAPGLAPIVEARADIYKMYARPSRGLIGNTIDTTGQFQQELGLDPRGQSMMALREQYSTERHYGALAKGLKIGSNLTDSWAYDWVAQRDQKTRSIIWQDFASIIGGLSQKMANANSDYGIAGMYVTGELAAQIQGLPAEIFQSSGITDRPGIYRIGRLFNRYEVYYTPRVVTETGGGASGQILCYGRATEVARNPIVMGESVAPMLVPLAMGSDMVYRDGFYARNFTNVNPHRLSALGFATINVTAVK